MSKKNEKVSTESYKGVRDFYPEDMFVQDYITSVWHHVLENYGYQRYEASILESSEIYRNKTSDEIVNEQTYSFVDRGGRDVTLRPEMTPSVARMIAKKQRELSFPLRWYSIPNVFRYERPQKGRLREHWQLNVDLFGLDKIDAEAELIDIASNIMRKFGLVEDDFVIKISDRKILDSLMDSLNLIDNKRKDFKKLLDKKNKMPAEEFESKMYEVVSKKIDFSEIVPNDSVTSLISKLKKRNINNVEFDPTLVRGFDYYTGIVFEIFDQNPDNNRSLFGGGRYDNLMELFDAEKVPAVGFGMGDVTIKEALLSRDLIPGSLIPAHLYICNLTEEANDYSALLANELRKTGLDIIVDYSNKKAGDQIRRADRNSIPYVLCVGEEEMKKNKFKIKELGTGKEKTVRRGKIADFIRKNISR